MKQFAAFLAALAAVTITLAVVLPRAVKPPPQRALDKMISALEKGKVSRAEKYTVSQLGLQKTRRAKKLYKAMYREMSYVVSDVQVDGDEAVISLSVTMVDMEALMTETSLEELSRSLDGKWSHRKFYKQLTGRIKAGEGDKTTILATVKMVKSDGKWLVDVQNSKKLRGALTGGMLSS